MRRIGLTMALLLTVTVLSACAAAPDAGAQKVSLTAFAPPGA